MPPWLLHHVVEQTAARLPSRPALCDEIGESSYAQLWRNSGRLAAYLQARGLAPGERVGIWMKKSRAAATAILAALRAGGAYVPLDPVAPPDRAAQLLRDCGIAFLLADPSLAATIAPPRHLITDDCAAAQPWAALPASSAPREVPRVAGDLAYVLYTSGSTGEPKGVMHSHRHALNFIAWASDVVDLGEADRVASVAPFHFDLSIFDLFASWSRGSCLHLLDAVTARFPVSAAAWLAARQITVCYAVPSFWIRLLPAAAGNHASRASLRAIVFAGEVFGAPALRQWRALAPTAAFCNWYGPTETNVCSGFRLPALPAELPDPLPIGAACPNFELRLGDEDGLPVADDQAGYLWARGEIFLGYWGDGVRTRRVCRVLPPGEAGGSIWYNTGDWARRGADGMWYFEGRRDDLVKLRGYRVSLLEVQRTLLRAPGVQAAAVAVDPDSESLAAYVVGAADVAPEPAVLRAWCGRWLPPYMVPAVHLVASLPETATGKIDRQRLRPTPPAGEGVAA